MSRDPKSETAGAACRLTPGKKCPDCDAVGARDRAEAQNGLNDTWAGDPYPHCMKERADA